MVSFNSGLVWGRLGQIGYPHVDSSSLLTVEISLNLRPVVAIWIQLAELIRSGLSTSLFLTSSAQHPSSPCVEKWSLLSCLKRSAD